MPASLCGHVMPVKSEMAPPWENPPGGLGSERVGGIEGVVQSAHRERYATVGFPFLFQP